jgi:hypothetical protein
MSDQVTILAHIPLPLAMPVPGMGDGSKNQPARASTFSAARTGIEPKNGSWMRPKVE